jgi:azurin
VYGSPVVNDKEHWVHAAIVSKDGLSVRLVVDSLREWYIHEIKTEGIRAYDDGRGLLHPVAYYTLNRIPDGSLLDVPRRTRQVPVVTTAPPAHLHDAVSAPAAVATPAPKADDTKPAPPKALAKRTTRKPDDWTKIDQTISIGTLPGLKYNKTYLSLKSGDKIKLTFSNNDDMPHNFVIVKPGTADAVGQAAMNLGLKGQEMSYIPKSANVLFHTRLVSPGASDAIYFVAPAPGDYTFVCTVPGHAQIMRGVLHVGR